MMATKVRSFFYIQALMKGKRDYPVWYGYTENEWLAQQFFKSMINNKLIIESFESKEEALNNITFYKYFGTLEDFHNIIRDMYGVVITGEDIIGTFPTDIYGNNPSNTKVEVISTCGDVLGGGFRSYAERFLFPPDKYALLNSLYLLIESAKLLRDSPEGYNVKNDIVNIVDILQQHPFLKMEDGVPFISDDMKYSEVIDIIRYGIWKGWYMPL